MSSNNVNKRNKIANLPLITTLYQHSNSQSFRINNPNYIFNDSELFNSDIDCCGNNSDDNELISLDVDGSPEQSETRIDAQLDTMSPFIDVSKYSKVDDQQRLKTIDTMSLASVMSSSSSSSGYSNLAFDFISRLTNSQILVNVADNTDDEEEEDDFVYIVNNEIKKKQRQQQRNKSQSSERSRSRHEYVNVKNQQQQRRHRDALNNASIRTKSTVLIVSSDEEEEELEDGEVAQHESASSLLFNESLDNYNYYEKLRLQLLETQENPTKFKRNTFATINTTDFLNDDNQPKEQQQRKLFNNDYENVMVVQQPPKRFQQPTNKNKRKNFTINEFLDENLLVEIFSYLSTIDKLTLSFVCKKWYHIIWSKHYQYKLWNRLIIDYSSTSGAAAVEYQSVPSTPSTTFALAYPAFTCKQPQQKQKPNADRLLKFLLNNNKTYPLCICVEYITIRGNHRLTDKGLELIATRCPELKYLSLRNCSNIKTNSIMKLILNCTNLKFIDLTGCFNITNLIYYAASAEQPQQQQQQLIYFYLQYVDLSDCTNVTDICIKNICKYCVYLKNLYLRRCKLVTDMSLLYIAKHCRNLKELSLCQCVKITDTGMKYLSGEFVKDNKQHYKLKHRHATSFSIHRYKIKYLSIAKCPLVSDKSLIYLANLGFFHQIKYLNLRGCTMVSDKFVKYFTGSNSKAVSEINVNKRAVLSKLPVQLKSFDMGKCSITDKSIEYLCRLQHLVPMIIQRLSLRNLDFITDNGISLLALNFKHLQHLNVAKCSKITSKSLQEVKKNCKACIIQHTSLTFC